MDEDSGFKRWFEDLAKGSMGTARERARVLLRFLRKLGMSPAGLVELALEDRRGVEDILMYFITVLHGRGYSPGYMENYVEDVRSWLEFKS